MSVFVVCLLAMTFLLFGFVIGRGFQRGALDLTVEQIQFVQQYCRLTEYDDDYNLTDVEIEKLKKIIEYANGLQRYIK